MKNKVQLIALTILIGFSACSKGGGTKEEQLATLKKEQTDLKGKIANLEAELKAEGKGPVATAVVAVPVSIEPVQLQTFSHYLEVQGKVDFEQNVGVSAKVPGVLTSVRVGRGDRVSKGQILATIDASVLDQGVAELKNSLDLARTVYEKQKRLWDQKIGTEIQYLTAKNNKDGLERRLSTMRQQQEQYYIKAPISGVIDDILPKVGEAVSPGLPVARIVNPNDIKVIADISEANAGKINKGDEAKVSLPDLDQEFQASVNVVSRTINGSNRSFPVELKLKNAQNLSLRPNMIAIVKVKDYEKPQTTVVPINVVQKDETGDFVYVAAKEGAQHVVRKKKITTGLSYAGKAEVTGGLAVNDQLITVGYQNLNEGQPVTF